jgi:hypothetical protein
MAQTPHSGNSSELLDLLAKVASNLDAMRTRIMQLQNELDSEQRKSESLLRANEELATECAQYKRTILAMIPPGEPFTEDEINNLLVNGVTFEKVLLDLEKLESA